MCPYDDFFITRTTPTADTFTVGIGIAQLSKFLDLTPNLLFEELKTNFRIGIYGPKHRTE